MIASLSNTVLWDICIIGGGATGLASALDAASRGYKTILLEQYDFAKGTSSRSTKLVHGGVRYLQQGNIRLVFEALKERGLLLKNAPHLVHNQQFIVPNYKWWEKSFYGIGLKIYDKMAGQLGLGPSVLLSKEETLERLPSIEPADLRGGVLYHDGQFDDARLAISIAQTAAQKGAVLLNYFPVTGLIKDHEKIAGVKATDSISGKDFIIYSKTVINATGVFTDKVLGMDDPSHQPMINPSQGIHLVVDKSFLPGSTAIMIPRTDDGRVLFAVPWHDKVVLGTTDTAVNEISVDPVPLEEEIDFVLNHIGRYLTSVPGRKDVSSMIAGLRPLVKQRSKKTAALSRDHLVTVAPSSLITITGGKWTTCRKMAEDVINIASKTANLEPVPCMTENLKLSGHDQPAPPPQVSTLDKMELRNFIQKAVQEEMCMTVEDLLARRSRELFLDARKAVEMAPLVAAMMAEQMNKDQDWIKQQIDIFNTIAADYITKT
jgi:glycerol-3-phosphate dehydrogenase